MGRGSMADGKEGGCRLLASWPRERAGVERPCCRRGAQGCDALGSCAAGAGGIEMSLQGRHWIEKGLNPATVVHVIGKQLVDAE